MSILDQFIALLSTSLAVGVPLTVLIQQVKPYIRFIEEQYSRKWYLTVIYLIRTVAAVFLVFQGGGAEIFRSVAPFLGGLSDFMVALIGVGLIVSGTEVVKPALDLITRVRSTVDESAESDLAAEDNG